MSFSTAKIALCSLAILNRYWINNNKHLWGRANKKEKWVWKGVKIEKNNKKKRFHVEDSECHQKILKSATDNPVFQTVHTYETPIMLANLELQERPHFNKSEETSNFILLWSYQIIKSPLLQYVKSMLYTYMCKLV